jgi:hypothetical protein
MFAAMKVPACDLGKTGARARASESMSCPRSRYHPEGRPTGPCRSLTALPVSRVSTRAKTFSPKDQKTKACVPEGMRSLNDPRQGSLPTVLLHLDQVQTGHPSPSAHQFRLPFNGLSPSELRRIFCSDEGDARDGA